MPRSENQKLKLLYIRKYLLENTDDEHSVTVSQIIKDLAGYGIQADRKTVYTDLEALRAYGMDIIMNSPGKCAAYHVGSREFEDVELKLLVDCIQTSNFVTQRKTQALIRKIESLTSVYRGKQLQRQVYVRNRVKNMDESVYYNVDIISSAISEGSQIRFRYYDYNVQKKRVLRRNGEYYYTSPYALIWVDQNYYLLSHNPGEDHIRHYRVDRMTEITLTGEERTGNDIFRETDISTYTTKVFYMFTGTERKVKLRFDNSLIGTVIDRFGRDISVFPDKDGHFVTYLDVVVSPQFYAWLFAFAGKAEILEPEEIRSGMLRQASAVMDLYQPKDLPSRERS